MHFTLKIVTIIVSFLIVFNETTVVLKRRRVFYRPSTARVRRVPPAANRTAEGAVKLVGGQGVWEGNVEIYHMGRWGSVCDDEWDLVDAHVVCRSLGYTAGALMATNNAQFGRTRKLIWMDNVYCNGDERALADCRFDGWKIHDCTTNEAAGVVCKTRNGTTASDTTGPVSHRGIAASPGLTDRTNATNTTANTNSTGSRSGRRSTGSTGAGVGAQLINDAPHTTGPPLATTFSTKIRKQWSEDINIRLIGGRNKWEGRVEVRVDGEWHQVCGDGWSLLEAMVVCRQLGLGYAAHAVQTSVFGGNNLSLALTGVRCKGFEATLGNCEANALGSVHSCPTGHQNIAGAICTSELPDLVPDEKEIESSAYLEDRMLMLLQCAMEENCLASSAYNISRQQYGWQFEQRRLLRFTARIANIGTADFRPFLPKHIWDWHACHRHYHSMEVFAHFDILDSRGKRVAEGHKASFCLEDNNCKDNSTRKYACANYGDQGISVGCADTYFYNIDCQWIDITDISPGIYQLKVSINPEFKVSELSFDNNAALCTFYYNQYMGRVYNCTLTRP